MEDLLEIYKQCDERNVVIQHMALLAGGLISHNWIDEGVAGLFFKESTIEEIEFALGPLSSAVIAAIEANEFLEVEEWLFDNNKLGYLIEIITPEYKHNGKPGDVWSYSFGCVLCKWFYGDTLREAIDLGFAWVDGVREGERMRRAEMCGHAAEV